MRLPFTSDQFFELFGRYNQDIGPTAPLLAGVATLVVLGAMITRRPWAGRAVFTLLAVLWLWNGVAYHGLYFARINPAAYAFAALFVAQGLIFATTAVGKHPGPPENGEVRGSLLAGALIGYALVVYPLWGAVLGHGYPNGPIFGVAPCPTTLFTFGALIHLRPRRRAWTLVIPSVWALIGTVAAVRLGVPQDFGLPVAAALAVLYLSRRR